ncbi:MAG TPA: hypothetical protein VFN76_07455, partial [Candidatus Limnocylindria bacterium]|nr:hypothetical protein [Candidatus Limnocylindria bacterium]
RLPLIRLQYTITSTFADAREFGMSRIAAAVGAAAVAAAVAAGVSEMVGGPDPALGGIPAVLDAAAFGAGVPVSTAAGPVLDDVPGREVALGPSATPAPTPTAAPTDATAATFREGTAASVSRAPTTFGPPARGSGGSVFRPPTSPTGPSTLDPGPTPPPSTTTPSSSPAPSPPPSSAPPAATPTPVVEPTPPPAATPTPDPTPVEPPSSTPECSDGLDNDGDFLADTGLVLGLLGDPQCTGPDDPSESF